MSGLQEAQLVCNPGREYSGKTELSPVVSSFIETACFLEASLTFSLQRLQKGRFRAKVLGQQRECLFPHEGVSGVVAPHCCGVHEMGPSCGENRTQK